MAASVEKAQGRTRQWQVATFNGLIMGQATRTDLVRKYGEPDRVETPEGQEANDPEAETWYVYEREQELGGAMTVVLDARTQVVRVIRVSPADSSLKRVVEKYGDDYVLTNYAFDECLGDEESSPLYESPGGPIKSLEYRHLGIAVRLNYQEKVDRVEFLSAPVGAPASKCKP